ncbi:hypothetical protein CUJ84_pRLN3000195 (plasmid) [Rhizobium leguminosarum]|uniref:Uncharacterized protein n=1 Tax=Rhizobium leguminosarum TaxID=384 RepID=A0A2K9ZGG7_RHILE|nr:hypothetical protein CUJ84_pRLN3000195 [Rhizobium leguminosarum]
MPCYLAPSKGVDSQTVWFVTSHAKADFYRDAQFSKLRSKAPIICLYSFRRSLISRRPHLSTTCPRRASICR